MPSRTDPTLARLRKIVASLPATVETDTWGSPHFRVNDKIFCGFGDEDSIPSIGFKLHKEHALQVCEDPRFRPAKYVGRHGWVSLDARTVKAKDWAMVAGMIEESYRLIAPKKLVEELDTSRG